MTQQPAPPHRPARHYRPAHSAGTRQKAPEPDGVPAAVRGRTLERALQVNAAHARNAADRLGGRDALGEHALILFSADFTVRPFRLSTATRLDYERSGGESLPELLASLADHAAAQLRDATRSGRRWDPRTPLEGIVLRSDPVTTGTDYVGLAVSTLDTPRRAWHRAKRHVTSADGLNLPGQGFIYLNDGTGMHFLRSPQMGSRAEPHKILSNRPVHSVHRPRIDHDLLTDAPTETAPIWTALQKLHTVLSYV
jgi:hypothetical protein